MCARGSRARRERARCVPARFLRRARGSRVRVRVTCERARDVRACDVRAVAACARPTCAPRGRLGGRESRARARLTCASVRPLCAPRGREVDARWRACLRAGACVGVRARQCRACKKTEASAETNERPARISSRAPGCACVARERGRVCAHNACHVARVVARMALGA